MIKTAAKVAKVASEESAPRQNVATAQKMNMHIYRLHTHKYCTDTI